MSKKSQTMVVEENFDQESDRTKMKPGKWQITSIKDPRFNLQGTGLVGTFYIPDLIMEKLEEIAECHHTAFPDDIKYTWTKEK